MDDDDKTLEAALSALKPNEVPEALEKRIFALFENTDAPSAGSEPELGKIVPFPLWRRLGTAAAVLVAGVGVFFAALNSFNPSSSNANGSPIADSAKLPLPAARVNGFQPVRAENVFEGVRDSGVFIGDDGGPVRELRYQFSDSFLWQDKANGSEIEIRVPHERRYTVPVRTD